MQLTDRKNTIGAIRLLLASLVIIAHCSAVLDGNSSREPLTLIFHTNLTIGALAVDGFFLLSGYLIAGSFMSNPRRFFLNRIVRIYPAFAVCSVLSVFLLAPFVGGRPPTSGLEWLHFVFHVLILHTPMSPGAFATEHLPTLNASAWTIPYEFRSYALAAFLGMIGLYKYPRALVAITLALLAGSLLLTFPGIFHVLASTPDWFNNILGKPSNTLRLTPIFMVGTCFRLIPVPLKANYAAISAIGLAPLMFVPGLNEVAFTLLGGYVIFWAAFSVKTPFLLSLNARDDISYGVYLYGWPVAATLAFAAPKLPLLALDGLTLLGAMALGWMSWVLVENPAQHLKIAWLSGLAKPVIAIKSH